MSYVNIANSLTIDEKKVREICESPDLSPYQIVRKLKTDGIESHHLSSDDFYKIKGKTDGEIESVRMPTSAKLSEFREILSYLHPGKEENIDMKFLECASEHLKKGNYKTARILLSTAETKENPLNEHMAKIVKTRWPFIVRKAAKKATKKSTKKDVKGFNRNYFNDSFFLNALGYYLLSLLPEAPNKESRFCRKFKAYDDQ